MLNKKPPVIFLSLLLFSSFINPIKLAGTEYSSAGAPAEPAMVGVVTGEGETELNLDAVVMVQAGKLSSPYKAYDEASQKKFAQTYFKAGRKLRMTFGGGEVGSVTVSGSQQGCNNLHATVTVNSTTRVRGQVKALVTSSTVLGKKSSSRRAPTDEERAAVLDLVKTIYLQHGVTASQFKSMTVTNLAATDLDNDGKYEFIGSFALSLKNKAQRDLFLIAETSDSGMRSAFTKFQAYQPPPEGFLESIDFVDQLDLDGDGMGEVFAVQGGFDAYGYVIFKKTAKVWRQVYTFMGDAC